MSVYFESHGRLKIVKFVKVGRRERVPVSSLTKMSDKGTTLFNTYFYLAKSSLNLILVVWIKELIDLYWFYFLYILFDNSTAFLLPSVFGDQFNFFFFWIYYYPSFRDKLSFSEKIISIDLMISSGSLLNIDFP